MSTEEFQICTSSSPQRKNPDDEIMMINTCTNTNENEEAPGLEISMNEIPKEVLDKYFGPQDLYTLSLNKSDQDFLIKLNQVMKETYFSLFFDNDLFPSFARKIPEIEDLLKVFEEDMSSFKFEKIFEFESFIDTILLFALQYFESLNQIKLSEIIQARNQLSQVALDAIAYSLRTIGFEERLRFLAINPDFVKLGHKSSSIVRINGNDIKHENLLELSQDFCQYLDHYYMKYIHDMYISSINNLLKYTFNKVLNPFKTYMEDLSQEELSILKNIHVLINDEFFTNVDDFQDLIDQFFFQIYQRIERFITIKSTIIVKMKRLLLEKAIGSILEDLERMPAADRQRYLECHRQVCDLITYESHKVDFNQFDIDLILEDQRILTRTLNKRDQMWFSHFRDE